MLFQEQYHDDQSTAVVNATGVLHIHERFDNYELFPWHCHAFYELQYYIDPMDPTRGTDRILQLFAPFQPHTCNDFGYQYSLLVQFSRRFIKRCVPSFPDTAMLSTGLEGINEAGIRIPKDCAIDMILRDIAKTVLPCRDDVDVADFNRRSAACHTPLFEMRLNSSLLRLFSHLLDENLVVIAQDGVMRTDAKLHELITRIIEKPEEQMSMREAAELSHMSYCDFSRNFKAVVGYGYADFRNLSRVSLAEELLRFDDVGSTEIAQRLNFGSASYFNRIFRRFTGVTPGEYKAMMQQPSPSVVSQKKTNIKQKQL